MSDIAIRVENLGKKYTLGGQKSGSFRESMTNLFSRNAKPKIQDPDTKEFWALEDINFEIKRGEAVGIIGRNGAGKSTLLKILSRITEPTKGRFEVFGRVSSLLEVGTGFHPELTGRENVYLNGTILGMKRAEVKAKFDEIVAFSGVEKFIDTPVKHYSSGMQVRLAFAVAAHLEPEILIIDEVLAVGDAEFQKKCLGKMEDVAGEGRTVIFVSHNMQAVHRLCKKAILLNRGNIKNIGKTEEIIPLYLESGSGLREVSKNGSGEIRMCNIQFLDKDNNIINTFRTLQAIKIEVEYEAYSEMKNVSFAICFNDHLENRVVSLWSEYYAARYNVEVGKFKIIYDVPSVHLLPGEYEVISYIGSNNFEIEQIFNLMKVSVGFSLNFGLSAEPRKSQGYYLETFNVKYLET